jgi:hypothetical protein
MDFVFSLKKDEKKKKIVMVAASRYQRDQLKITATALGINMQDLIANIFEHFFEANQKEIKFVGVKHLHFPTKGGGGRDICV